MGRFIALTVLALLLAGLAVTNPNVDAFAERFAERAQQELSTELGLEGPLGAAIGGASRSVVEAAIRETAVRRNYGVASTFTLPAAGEDPVYLGIAGTFVQVSGP